MGPVTFELKDSGNREDFSTGSRRDTREGKGRFDLIPTMALRRLAAVYEKGAVKYGDDNWKKGQPLKRMLDSALRHIVCAAEGQEDEDHLFQAVWNLVAIAWTLEEVRSGRLPRELCDLPYLVRSDTFAGEHSIREFLSRTCGITNTDPVAVISGAAARLAEIGEPEAAAELARGADLPEEAHKPVPPMTMLDTLRMGHLTNLRHPGHPDDCVCSECPNGQKIRTDLAAFQASLTADKDLECQADAVSRAEGTL